MKRLLLCFAVAATLSLHGADGLAGRWVSAQGASPEIKLAITPEQGLWNISHSWSGPSAMSMDTANYTLKGTETAGDLTQTPAKPKGIPAQFSFTRKGDILTVKVPAGDFAGQHTLTRFSLTTPAAAKALAQADKKPATTVPKLLGNWRGAEDAPVQAALNISAGKNENEVVISQQWQDQAAGLMDTNTVYAVQIQGGRGTLQAVKSSPQDSIPAVMKVLVDGNHLIVTLPSGVHAGTHLLTK